MSSKKRSCWAMAAVGAALAATAMAAVQPFPGDLPGTQIGSGLPSAYEPSAGAWHPRLERVFLVHDGGTLTRMDRNGADMRHWSIGGDLEGVAIADPATDLVYVGIEHPDGIKEFDLASGTVKRTFNLTPWMVGADNSGLEALVFVPDPAHPEGGVFFAGHQGEGKIYVFRLPIRSSSTSTTVTLERTIGPFSGRGDLSGLDWDWQDKIVYAIWDGGNVLARLSPAGTLIDEFQLPGNDQEGIAVRPCEIFVMEDVGKEVWRYGFPTTSADGDIDGVGDCDDLCPATPLGATVDADGCPLTAGGCTTNAQCDDGLWCNGSETCSAGACVAGTLPNCADAIGCTTDACDESKDQCTHAANNAACNDGLWCNGTETCSVPGGCVAGQSPLCSTGTCSEASDSCVHCVDDLDCPTGDACDQGSGTCVRPVPIDPLPIRIGDRWSYRAGIDNLAAGWMMPEYDDAGWSVGDSGFGYGDDCRDLHATELSDMHNGYLSVFVRKRFWVDTPSALDTLRLTVDYDDGFVAYLNGQEVARSNTVGTPPGYEEPAVADHECSGSPTSPSPPATFEIPAVMLRPGENVFAIQGHNLSLDSNDFSLIPTLEGVVADSCAETPDCADDDLCTIDRCVAGTCSHETPDGDADGVTDCVDNCANAANADQQDFDADGLGDACEDPRTTSDADGSGRVDGTDLARLARAFATACAEYRYDPSVDIDRDCDIDGDDLAAMASRFGS